MPPSCRWMCSLILKPLLLGDMSPVLLLTLISTLDHLPPLLFHCFNFIRFVLICPAVVANIVFIQSVQQRDKDDNTAIKKRGRTIGCVLCEMLLIAAPAAAINSATRLPFRHRAAIGHPFGCCLLVHPRPPSAAAVAVDRINWPPNLSPRSGDYMAICE